MNSGVNLGSGQRRFESTDDLRWYNCDVVSRPPDQVPDVVCDSRALPFDDASMDIVVAWHNIEHFGCGEADSVVREAWRVLKPGGAFIAATPDMRQLCIRWLTGNISDYIFLVNTYGAFQSCEGDRHRWGYTQESLISYVKGLAPWAEVVRWSGVFQHRSMNLCLDWWMASVEATK